MQPGRPNGRFSTRRAIRPVYDGYSVLSYLADSFPRHDRPLSESPLLEGEGAKRAGQVLGG
jgi:hypothetical protein